MMIMMIMMMAVYICMLLFIHNRFKRERMVFKERMRELSREIKKNGQGYEMNQAIEEFYKNEKELE
mgnify:CR=1 FL=1